MRPLTDSCPKPLLKVAGKPLIEHHVERLAAIGIREIVINVSYLGEQIQDYLGSGQQWGVELTYSPEAELLETGGGIFKALEFLGHEQPFLVVNGDVWCDFDLTSVTLAAGDDAHLVLVSNPPHHPTGDFYLEQNRVKVALSGSQQQSLTRALKLTFSGISILHPRLFKEQTGGKFALAPLLRDAMTNNRVGGVAYDGFWLDVGTPERLAELDSRLRSGC